MKQKKDKISHTSESWMSKALCPFILLGHKCHNSSTVEGKHHPVQNSGLHNHRTTDGDEKCNLVQVAHNHGSVFRLKVPHVCGLDLKSLNSTGSMRKPLAPPGVRAFWARLQTEAAKPIWEVWEPAVLILGKHTGGTAKVSTHTGHWALFTHVGSVKLAR